MKTNQLLRMTAVAMLTVLGLSACNKESQPENNAIPGEPGQPTAMQLVVTMPRVSTYASTDANATDDEIALKNAYVMVYETVTGNYVMQACKKLTMADFDPVSGTPDTYKLKAASEITTTTGPKKIYVALNFPVDLPALGSPLTALTDVAHTLASVDALSNTTSGFAMLNAVAVDVSLVDKSAAEYNTVNNIKVTVKRLVAKVSVQEKAGLTTGGGLAAAGGTFTNLQFALGHANKQIFPVQKRTGVAPNIMVQDPNWESYVADNFFGIEDYALASTAYRSLDPAGAAIGALHPVYAPENTSQHYQAEGENVSYISVRSQFKPDQFSTGAGVSKGANTGAAKSFWTVTKADDSMLYFDVEADADTYLPTAGAGAVKSPEYVNGLCYWRLYINPKGVADAAITGSVANRYDVLRNNYYRTTITNITGLGSHVDEGTIAEETTIVAEVTIEPWQLVSDDYVLE